MEKEILIKARKIKNRTEELAKSISEDYKNTDKLLITVVLKGAFIFAADLIREISCPIEVTFIKASSYEGMNRNDELAEYVIMEKDSFKNTNVLIVEDIVDTGETVFELTKRIKKLGAGNIKICSLLYKKAKTRRKIDIDYKGFEIPDGFVIGYGLDWNESYRNYKDIFTIKEK